MKQDVQSPFAANGFGIPDGQTDGQLLYRCSATGAWFFDRGTLASASYEDFYVFLKSWNEERFAEESAWRRPKFTFQLRELAGLTSGRDLLDVGAGPGYLCDSAKKLGWKAQGVEISAAARAVGEEHFDVDYVELDEVPERSKDVITCYHVLEHLTEPVTFLNELRSKLRAGGLLALHVPHEQPLTFLLREKLDWSRDHRTTLYSNIHISGFAVKSLSSIVTAQGFETESIGTHGMWSGYYDPFFVKQFLAHKAYTPMVKKFLRHLVELAGIPFGRGDWVVGIFRKS